jgi:hypothetical protein
MMRAQAPLLALLVAAWACSDPAPAPTVFAKSSPGPTSDYFDSPWPDDRRLDPEGFFVASEFPNPTRAGFFESVRRGSDGLAKGWSVSAPVYVPFTGAVDTARLPADPAAYVSSRAPFFLVAVDVGSRYEGLQVPLEWRFEAAPTSWLPGNVLVARPVRGFSLEPGTRYAFVVTTRMTDRSGVPIGPEQAFADALRGGGVPADAAHFKPLAELAARRGWPLDEIAGATLFTTQDGQGELRELRDLVESMPAPEVNPRDVEWDRELAEPAGVSLVKTTYLAPNFMFGKPPYATEGGEFKRDGAGRFRVARQETMRLSICLPRQPVPAGGFPLVFVSHGTGGDWRSYVSDKTCERLAAQGVASMGIDNVLHGPRAEGVKECLGMPAENCFFNPVNLVASRNLMRQAAVDHVTLRKLAEGLRIPANIAGTNGDVRFDLRHPGFFGHSQGGLTGALYLAVDRKVAGGMLSGAGGHITTTLLERADAAGLQGGVKDLVERLLFEMKDEELDQLHPGAAFLQLVAEVADPLTYAKSWLLEPDGRRKSVLLVNGTLDPNTPIGCALAYALRGGVPPYETGWEAEPFFPLAGLLPQPAPVRGNVAADARLEAVTAALRQFPGAGHFPAFDDPSAVQSWTTFLAELVKSGLPTVPRP